MSDLLDIQLKQEIEKISEDVKGIMKKVAELYPSTDAAESQKGELEAMDDGNQMGDDHD